MTWSDETYDCFSMIELYTSGQSSLSQEAQLRDGKLVELLKCQLRMNTIESVSCRDLVPAVWERCQMDPQYTCEHMGDDHEPLWEPNA